MDKVLIYTGEKVDAFKTRTRLIAKSFKIKILDELPESDTAELEDQITELEDQNAELQKQIAELSDMVEKQKAHIIDIQKAQIDELAEILLKEPEPQQSDQQEPTAESTGLDGLDNLQIEPFEPESQEPTPETKPVTKKNKK